jgi:hypothetical protein
VFKSGLRGVHAFLNNKPEKPKYKKEARDGHECSAEAAAVHRAILAPIHKSSLLTLIRCASGQYARKLLNSPGNQEFAG